MVSTPLPYFTLARARALIGRGQQQEVMSCSTQAAARTRNSRSMVSVTCCARQQQRPQAADCGRDPWRWSVIIGWFGSATAPAESKLPLLAETRYSSMPRGRRPPAEGTQDPLSQTVTKVVTVTPTQWRGSTKAARPWIRCSGWFHTLSRWRAAVSAQCGAQSSSTLWHTGMTTTTTWAASRLQRRRWSRPEWSVSSRPRRTRPTTIGRPRFA